MTVSRESLEKLRKGEKFCRIDIDPAEMNKNVVITHGITGDVKVVLSKLNQMLEQQNHSEWIQTIEAYKAKYPMTYHPDVLSGPFVVEEIYRQTKGDAVIVTEVGQNQMWAAQYYKYQSREHF